jgi:hypothetical protein
LLRPAGFGFLIWGLRCGELSRPAWAHPVHAYLLCFCYAHSRRRVCVCARARLCACATPVQKVCAYVLCMCVQACLCGAHRPTARSKRACMPLLPPPVPSSRASLSLTSRTLVRSRAHCLPPPHSLSLSLSHTTWPDVRVLAAKLERAPVDSPHRVRHTYIQTHTGNPAETHTRTHARTHTHSHTCRQPTRHPKRWCGSRRAPGCRWRSPSCRPGS